MRPGGGESGRRHLGFEHEPAVACGDDEGERARWRRGDARARPQRHRRERRRQRERVAQPRSALYRAKRPFDDDNGSADALTGHRIDANEVGAERAWRNQQRGGSLNAFLQQIGYAARPRNWFPDRVIHGDAGAPRLVGRHGCGDDVEEPFDGRLIPRRGAHRFRLAGDAHRDRSERGGVGVEPVPELGLHPAQRVLVGGAETSPFEAPPGQTNDERGWDADAHDAQDEGHRQAQDTRVL